MHTTRALSKLEFIGRDEYYDSENFNIVLQALVIILEDQLEKKEKIKREKEIAKLINDVHGKLKSK